MRFVGCLLVSLGLVACGSSNDPDTHSPDSGSADSGSADSGSADSGSADSGPDEPGVIRVVCETAVASDGQCSLREALANATAGERMHADCAAGATESTVMLPSGCTFELSELDNGQPAREVGRCSGDDEPCDTASDCEVERCVMSFGSMQCEYSYGFCLTHTDCGQTCDVTEIPAIGNALPRVTGTVVVEGNGSTLTRMTGAVEMRFFEVAAGGSLTLRDLTLSGGATPADGGAILVHGALTLSGSTVTGSSATGEGGAIAGGSEGCRIIVNGSTFEGCAAEGAGGAIEQSGCVLEVDQSAFSGNASETAGGAVNCNSRIAACTVTSSTFTGNSAEHIGGGAISFFNDGVKAVAQCTFQGNTSTADGGALMAFSGPVTVAFSTFSGNSCEGDGGAIYSDTTVTLESSVLESEVDVGGEAPDVAGTVTSGGYNHIGSTPDGFTAGEGDVTGVSAELSALADNGGPTRTMAPAAASPVVDAVPAGTRGCGTTHALDQRGSPRPGSGSDRCDKGAVEL